MPDSLPLFRRCCALCPEPATAFTCIVAAVEAYEEALDASVGIDMPNLYDRGVVRERSDGNLPSQRGALKEGVIARSEGVVSACFVRWTSRLSGANAERDPPRRTSRWDYGFSSGSATIIPADRRPNVARLHGRAFVANDGTGYMADAYYKRIEPLSDWVSTRPSRTTGSYEVGHLLLGAGHSPTGIMRASWNAKDMEAVGQNYRKFNREQADRIHRVLRIRASSK